MSFVLLFFSCFCFTLSSFFFVNAIFALARILSILFCFQCSCTCLEIDTWFCCLIAIVSLISLVIITLLISSIMILRIAIALFAIILGILLSVTIRTIVASLIVIALFIAAFSSFFSFGFSTRFTFCLKITALRFSRSCFRSF